MNITIILKLAIALALGLIVGMERGWSSRLSPKGLRIAGIRTFGFVGLFGGVSALLAGKLGAFALAIAFFGLALIVTASYIITTKETQDFGITTELSILITFVLGALAVSGFEAEALATSVVMAFLLGFKQELHKTLEKLDRRELVATLQLLLVAAVALPLLPDQNLGPWSALNPRTIGWLVLLIASISYLGYFAMRIFGTRVGLLATAVLGGLVSSTAVTVTYGRIARKEHKAFALLGAGISLAAGTMAVRILIEVAIVNRSLLPFLAAPITMLAIVPLVAAFIIATRTPQTTTSADELKLNNPVELSSALGFAAILSILFILVRTVEAWFGNAGIYILSAISGITDVDAVSLSLAQATKVNLPLSVGATGILIAAMVNTVVKALLATFIGGWYLSRWCATILLSTLGLSLLVLNFT